MEKNAFALGIGCMVIRGIKVMEMSYTVSDSPVFWDIRHWFIRLTALPFSPLSSFLLSLSDSLLCF